jgi:hypothetical protein
MERRGTELRFQNYNKATAAVLSGAFVTILASVMNLGGEVQGALQTIITFGLVLAIPNKG